METDELPVLDPNVDFREVPPLHQKRTIAFVNHFIMKTVSFLNTFAASCESRLMDLECKLERVEASLLILESQLSSIPWLDEKANNTASSTEIKIVAVQTNDDIKTLDLPDVEIEQQQKQVICGDDIELKVQQDSVDGPKACEDPRFIKFFKMVQFGVPLPAVKLKMETEGLDATILDKPNCVVPGFDNNVNTTENNISDSTSSS